MNRIRAHIAASLLLLVVFTAPAAANAASKAVAAAHDKAAANARAKATQQQALAHQLQGETAKLDQQVASLQAAADALDPQIKSATTRSLSIRAQVDAIRGAIALKNQQIAITQAEVAREQALLAERAVDAYKQGDGFSAVLVLLDSRDFADLVARTEFVSRILTANSTAAAQVSASRAKLGSEQADLSQTLADLTAKQQEADAVEANVRNLQADRQDKVDAQQSVLNAKSELLAESQQNAKRLFAVAEAEAEEASRIKAELANRHGSGKFHGSMAWPVPGFYTITSPFGYRVHPILHKRVFHAGIDISGSGINGHEIVAAAAGTVIATGARGGYGNVVMIDHGNGVVTIYAHQQDGGIRVSVGQHVKKGQRIGTVGSTGMSTGPHCHFEVRVNGSAVNPENYL
jgi:murein DD-endopeptidase MepM/ murein hydrolase activator NlpD